MGSVPDVAHRNKFLSFASLPDDCEGLSSDGSMHQVLVHSPGGDHSTQQKHLI